MEAWAKTRSEKDPLPRINSVPNGQSQHVLSCYPELNTSLVFLICLSFPECMCICVIRGLFQNQDGLDRSWTAYYPKPKPSAYQKKNPYTEWHRDCVISTKDSRLSSQTIAKHFKTFPTPRQGAGLQYVPYCKDVVWSWCKGTAYSHAHISQSVSSIRILTGPAHDANQL